MKQVVFLLLASFYLNSAGAWGPTGHRAVGEVAEKYLSKWKLRKIKKLLDGESLARVSNWPDKIKSDPDNYRYTYSWHYTNWPVGQDQYDPNQSGSLITSIQDNIKILKDKKKSKSERAFALKFLVHLIGDLHQPLHVGNGEDRGGNRCKVYYQKELVNLHKMWDESMIEFSQLSFTELARFVIDKHGQDKKMIRNLQKDGILTWAKESKHIRETLYPAEIPPQTDTDQNTASQSSQHQSQYHKHQKGHVCKVDHQKGGLLLAENSLNKKYCKKDVDLPDEEIPRLGYRYAYKFMPVLEKRIFEAGVRLAKVLEEAL